MKVAKVMGNKINETRSIRLINKWVVVSKLFVASFSFLVSSSLLHILRLWGDAKIWTEELLHLLLLKPWWPSSFRVLSFAFELVTAPRSSFPAVVGLRNLMNNMMPNSDSAAKTIKTHDIIHLSVAFVLFAKGTSLSKLMLVRRIRALWVIEMI